MLKMRIIILLSFIFIACTKEVEIKIPDQKQNLVVYSTIAPFLLPRPKSLHIDIKNTKYIFDSTNSYIIDANVFLYINNTFTDTIKYIDSVKTYPIIFFPKEGDKYSIVVQKKGYKTIDAMTYIPSRVRITDTLITPIAYFDETGSVFSEISITFTDPGNEVNYYELAVSKISFSYDNPKDFYELSTNDKIVTSESYYPSLIRFYVDKPKYLLFNDTRINGLKHTLNVYYSPPQHQDDARFISDHFISIHLRNVTEEYYKFKTTMIKHLYNKQEDILYGMNEPINVISNINNGYGLFAGYNFDIVSLHIDELVISK